MKNKVMMIAGLSLLVGTFGFFFLTNKGHCYNESCNSLNTITTGGQILPFSDENLLKALERNDKIAYYFQANRCGNCKLLADELEERGIPVGSTILTVDFDKQLELRKKYEVNNLHTIVLVNKEGEMIQKDISGEYDTVLQLLQ